MEGEFSEARILARARTLTVLERLDPHRKSAVMQFLVEAELVQGVKGRGSEPIILLTGANLSGADLSSADLSGAELYAAGGVTEKQLEAQAKYLEGAIKPDGREYEY